MSAKFLKVNSKDNTIVMLDTQINKNYEISKIRVFNMTINELLNSGVLYIKSIYDERCGLYREQRLHERQYSINQIKESELAFIREYGNKKLNEFLYSEYYRIIPKKGYYFENGIQIYFAHLFEDFAVLCKNNYYIIVKCTNIKLATIYAQWKGFNVRKVVKLNKGGSDV